MTPQPLRRFVQFADLHASDLRPIARLDPDWISTQRKAVRFLVDMAIQKKCPLVGVGDILDKTMVSDEVLVMLITEFKRLRSHGLDFYLIAGNHCLKGHNSANISTGSIGVLLEVFPKIPQIDGVQDAQHFGDDKNTGAQVTFTHRLIFKDEKSKPPMAKGLTAQELLDALPNSKWVLTGDFHRDFHHISEDGRHVLNTGNVIAHNASMIETTARIAYVDLDAEVVEWIDVPDDPEMLSREHLDIVEAKETRIAAFLERVKKSEDANISFKDKLEKRFGQTDIEKTVHSAYLEIKAETEKEGKK